MPSAAWSQLASASITGVVRDTSGAVMPGVTVEATSPALIEKVRSAITDDQGQYRLVNLVPGTYSISFVLPGFATFRRDDLVLPPSFTATVNAELRVGALEESITVSGEAPVVDVQSARQTTTITQLTLDSLPTTKRVGQFATIIPGATYASPTFHDVGGMAGEGGMFAVHGGRTQDVAVNIEGMNVNLTAVAIYSFNPAGMQEISVQTGGGAGESTSGGVQLNIVPKDGGNTFTGTLSSAYSGPSLQTDNLTSDLRARGLEEAGGIKKSYDVGGALGGPIKKDRVWFYSSLRTWGAQQYAAGTYFNATQGTKLGTDPEWMVVPYTPDSSRPTFDDKWYNDASLRLTWQATQKQKVVASYSIQNNCSCNYGLIGQGAPAPTAPKVAAESLDHHYYSPDYMPIVSWTYPATSRLLVEAGWSAMIYNLYTHRLPETGETTIAITDLASNFTWGSRAQPYVLTFNQQYQQRASMSYITGAHAFKMGVDLRQNNNSGGPNRFTDPNKIIGARDYTFRDMVPNRVRIWSVPTGNQSRVTRYGIYAQDQWTANRLTLNLSLRYDSVDGSVPDQHLIAGPFVPARDFAAVSDDPDYQDINPRVSAAYDVLGNGRTAIKASLGRFVPIISGATFNPVSAQPASATRTWNDSFFGAGDPRTGNYVPDCVLDASVPGLNGECGRLSEQTFGQVTAGNTRYADDALTGFNDQFSNWQGSVSLQQELRPGMALNVGYFRTWYNGFVATDNRAVAAADFDSYCVMAPVDDRLPGGGGYELCGLYDVSSTKFGLTDNLVTLASNYGRQTEIYNGVDVTVSARFLQGGQFSGGLSVGRTVTDNCFTMDNPQLTFAASTGGVLAPRTSPYCHVSPPWASGATQVKFLVLYPLPWALQTSATYQNSPGIPITAARSYSNAEVRASASNPNGLKRDLSAGATANVTIDLIPPNSMFEDRLQQLDVRVTRNFQMGRTRLRANFDVYNLFNGSTILAANYGYGAQWLKPSQILGARIFKFSGQLDF
jgi:hypothetical protein